MQAFTFTPTRFLPYRLHIYKEHRNKRTILPQSNLASSAIIRPIQVRAYRVPLDENYKRMLR